METNHKRLTTPSNYDLVVSKLPVAKSTNYTITAADTWEEVEALRFTVPTGKIVSITVGQTFSNTKPVGVEVCIEINSDKIKSVVHFEDTSTYTVLSASGVYNNTSGAPKTLYVFVRAQGTGTNTVALCYQICN